MFVVRENRLFSCLAFAVDAFSLECTHVMLLVLVLELVEIQFTSNNIPVQLNYVCFTTVPVS